MQWFQPNKLHRNTCHAKKETPSAQADPPVQSKGFVRTWPMHSDIYPPPLPAVILCFVSLWFWRWFSVHCRHCQPTLLHLLHPALGSLHGTRPPVPPDTQAMTGHFIRYPVPVIFTIACVYVSVCCCALDLRSNHFCCCWSCSLLVLVKHTTNVHTGAP